MWWYLAFRIQCGVCVCVCFVFLTKISQLESSEISFWFSSYPRVTWNRICKNSCLSSKCWCPSNFFSYFIFFLFSPLEMVNPSPHSLASLYFKLQNLCLYYRYISADSVSYIIQFITDRETFERERQCYTSGQQE